MSFISQIVTSRFNTRLPWFLLFFMECGLMHHDIKDNISYNYNKNITTIP